MQHDWILDVLADLKTYAQTNGLSQVAEQLEDTRIVAMAEIASELEGQDFGLGADDASARAFASPIGASRRA
ncbi:hypothetical protein [Primorskyibacter sp. S187A]|uniref:hypothetical protein n=1 Tax=Primorskyibacter sp. S187A TaxID=3415130 RepID=UPI003C79A0B3